MSSHKEIKKITVPLIQIWKAKGEKIAMLTAYDYTFAQIFDQANLDVILVGDSAANVMAGYETTLPISLDEMIYHAASVKRAVKRALVVADLPFGSYQGSKDAAFESAVKMMKQSGVEALKLEGGIEIAEKVKMLVTAGIPIMGHLGLTPQSVNQFGGYGLRAKETAEADKLKSDAIALEKAGAFAIVLEKVPALLAKEVTELLSIPTIGIGAGANCDGQVLVMQDMLGLNTAFLPKFVRKYGNLSEQVTTAIQSYSQDVKDGNFPNCEESY